MQKKKKNKKKYSRVTNYKYTIQCLMWISDDIKIRVNTNVNTILLCDCNSNYIIRTFLCVIW